MLNRKLTVLVTGSEGFIGKHLCRALEQHEHVNKVIHFDINHRLRGDVCDRYYVSRIYSENDIHVVFHLAAITNVEYRHRQAVELNYINNIGTHYILDYAPKHCRVVLTSSVHCEDKPMSVYAASKLGAEALLKAYTNMGLIEGVILRLTSVVGRGMTHGVVKDFVDKLHSDSPTLDIIGEDPGSTRPYVHIDDVVDKLIYHGIIQNERERWIRNVSSFDVMTVDEVADIVMQITGITKPKCWLGNTWLGDKSYIRGYSDYVDMKYPSTKQAIIQAVKDLSQDELQSI